MITVHGFMNCILAEIRCCLLQALKSIKENMAVTKRGEVFGRFIEIKT